MLDELPSTRLGVNRTNASRSPWDDVAAQVICGAAERATSGQFVRTAVGLSSCSSFCSIASASASAPPLGGRRFGRRDRLDRLDPRFEIRILGRAARESGAFDAGLDEFLDMRGNELQPAEFLGENHLQTSARQLVGDPEAVEIKLEDALLLVVGRIAHADMRVEASGAPGQRLVDRLAMICRGDGDDVGVGRGPREHLQQLAGQVVLDRELNSGSDATLVIRSRSSRITTAGASACAKW